ncbi:hypothetical protein E2C01_071030 [Portunus trituberculatus]|uniref:Uncharacterized protein n=1 Tax=Portunus trituberculatus TaxID=210409 RepID=A0A5B7I2Z0_PORTR|nr:hypothetical protein [Portunus trituberculatus]
MVWNPSPVFPTTDTIPCVLITTTSTNITTFPTTTITTSHTTATIFSHHLFCHYHHLFPHRYHLIHRYTTSRTPVTASPTTITTYHLHHHPLQSLLHPEPSQSHPLQLPPFPPLSHYPFCLLPFNLAKTEAHMCTQQLG